MSTAAALIFFLFIFTPALAQTISVSLWPPLLDAMIKPGKSLTQVYRLKNQGDDTRIKVSISAFSAADEQGRINLEPNQPVPAYFSLLNADLPAQAGLPDFPLEINLKAGETQELVLKISVPETAPEADYPVALVAETITSGLLGGSGSIARPALAVPILLTISQTGQPQRLARIEEFTTENKFIDSFDRVNFRLRVKNQSFTRLTAVGQVEIFNIFGKKTVTLPLRQDHVLAGTIRQLKMEGLPAQAGSDPSISWDPAFLFGRYTATATITPTDTTNTVSQTIIFWALPYKLLGGLILAGGGYFLLTFAAKTRKLKP